MASHKTGRVNPFSLARPGNTVHTKTFDEPGAEHSFTISLRRLDNAEQMQAYAKAEELVAQFIGVDGDPPEAEFPYVGGEPVALSEPLFMTAALLNAAQADKPDSDRFSVLEWVALSVTMPHAWKAATKWGGRIIKGEADALKNALSEAAAPS